MEHLRRSIILLVVTLALIFNIERLNSSAAGDASLHGVLYLLAAVGIVAVLAWRWLQNRPLWVAGAGAATAYLIARLAVPNGRPIVAGEEIYVTITELAFLLGAVAIAWIVARRLRAFEATVLAFTLSDADRRILQRGQDDALIEIELDRCRRHDRPLSVIMLRPDGGTRAADPFWLVHDIPAAFADRLLFAQLARVVCGELRSTDIVVEGARHDCLLLLAPETDAAGALALAQRASAAAREIGVAAAYGAATFPSDALTFDDLITEADGRARRPIDAPRPVVSAPEMLTSPARTPRVQPSFAAGQHGALLGRDADGAVQDGAAYE
jgi:hypothetical protein